MNYKEKKYLLQDKWLKQNLNKFDFFAIGHIKSCNSDDWTKLQKDLSKSNLKIKSVSFRNLNNLIFFSKLSSEITKTLFKGKMIIIYNDLFTVPEKNIIDELKSIPILRPFILYCHGRFLNLDSSESLNKITVTEWNDIFNQLNGGVQITEVLSSSQRCCADVLQHQYRTILNLLMINDSK